MCKKNAALAALFLKIIFNGAYFTCAPDVLNTRPSRII